MPTWPPVTRRGISKEISFLLTTPWGRASPTWMTHHCSPPRTSRLPPTCSPCSSEARGFMPAVRSILAALYSVETNNAYELCRL